MSGSARQCGQDPLAGNAVYGVDVSVYQGVIDFKKLAAATSVRLSTTMFNVKDHPHRAGKTLPGKVVFVSARISDGLKSKEGQRFIDNVKGIREAGLVVGAYQFLRPEQDPAAQANYFIQQLDKAGGYKKGDLPPTVDIEVNGHTTPAKVQAAVAIWLKIVGDHYNVRPMVYSLAGISNYLGDKFIDSPLWIANFYEKCPVVPVAWNAAKRPWAIFQFDDAGAVPGLRPGAYIDLDVFNGTRDDFDRFVGAKP